MSIHPTPKGMGTLDTSFMDKKKRKKECNHLFEHKVTTGRSSNKEDKKIHKWLVHKCKKCGIETCEGKLERF